ncbi:GGDEF domain-containing protein [Motiliproteus coralliicola]|uniref:diguanylate cyclase n=1 Tax=Motiliproteus coralliicola TaxID=2283196 RepID=A0A369WUW5_9GAMM|nr:diguanylate cyclase [Motiliproteus coralliicola]RDE24859.1 GGDEF domain-containing protein [Motiliproteus coralliicola]
MWNLSDSFGGHRTSVLALVIGFVTVLLLIAITTTSLGLHRNNLIVDHQTRLAMLNGHIGQQVAQSISGAQQLLKGIASTLPLVDAKASEINERLVALKSNDPQLMDLLILDRNGEIAYWTGTGTPPSVKDRPYSSIYREQPSTQVWVGEPKLSRVHQDQWFFAVSIPVRSPSNDVVAIMVAIIKTDYLRDVLMQLVDDPNISASIHHSNDKVYAQINRNANTGPKLSLTQELRSHPLKVTTECEYQTVLSSYQDIQLWASLATLVLIFCVCCLTLLLLIRIRKQARLSIEDPLTKTLNRREFMRRGDEELTACQRYDRSFSIIMLDIDNFKAVNDTRGHHIGDLVIQAIGKILNNQSRKNDIVARYGGEEFVILLPEATAEEAGMAAEKLCKVIRTLKTRANKQVLQVTASLGVAQWHAPGEELASVIERADRALYQAKALGKDQVVRCDKNIEGDA